MHCMHRRLAKFPHVPVTWLANEPRGAKSEYLMFLTFDTNFFVPQACVQFARIKSCFTFAYTVILQCQRSLVYLLILLLRIIYFRKSDV